MNLDDWRSRINDLDNRILQLLNQRAEAALQIGDLKRRQDAPLYAPEREAEVLRRLTASAGPLPAEAVVAIWREILSGCRALESTLTVAYLGPQATFTHQAALQRFGASVSYRPARSTSEVFDEVERRRADFGVVPVENSTEGAVNVTLDRLIDSDVVICGELRLDISQQLLSRAGELSEVKRVLSHPQGLAQCRAWLAEHLPDVPTEEVLSTALAAEMAAGDATIAAIASAPRPTTRRHCAKSASGPSSRRSSDRIRPSKRREHANAVGVARERTHPGHRALRARQADRGARTGAHDLQPDQARVEREPLAAVRPRPEGDHRRVELPGPVSGRERLLPPAGAGQEARGDARSGRARQRLERTHRAAGPVLPASGRRGGGAPSLVRRVPDDRPGRRRRARHGDAEGFPAGSRRDGAGDHADDEDRVSGDPEQPDRHDRHARRGRALHVAGPRAHDRHVRRGVP